MMFKCYDLWGYNNEYAIVTIKICTLLCISGGGDWTTDGCKIINSESVDDTNTVKCNCTHLTNFAVLVVSLIM